MATVIQPWQILVAAAAGWIGRHQDAVIDFLREENRILKQQFGGRRLRLTDAQRRRLAAKGRTLGYRVLSEVATIVTPDTILRWHRRLIAKKWDYSNKRRDRGRPSVMKEISRLVVRFARENPTWGYTRIQGALANLGHSVARTTVAKILKQHGNDPAPERGQRMPWSTFLKCHWECLVAASFVDHYEERNHQGRDNQLVDPTQDVGHADGEVQCRERLGGILRYYYRQAAQSFRGFRTASNRVPHLRSDGLAVDPINGPYAQDHPNLVTCCSLQFRA